MYYIISLFFRQYKRRHRVDRIFSIWYNYPRSGYLFVTKGCSVTKILVIIPAYNEQHSICGVIKRLKESISSLSHEIDYIIVNDCSTDKTGDICRENGYKHISFPINLGIGGGVQAGYIYAARNGYDIAVQMDGDGQHDPVSLGDLISPIINGEADMVIGSRFLECGGFRSTGLRRAGISWLSAVICACCGKRIKDVTSGYRATGKELTEYYSKNYARDYPEPEAIVSALKNGYRVTEIPVVMHERTGGISSIRALGSVYYMIKVTLAILIGAGRKRGKAVFR